MQSENKPISELMTNYVDNLTKSIQSINKYIKKECLVWDRLTIS